MHIAFEEVDALLGDRFRFFRSPVTGHFDALNKAIFYCMQHKLCAWYGDRLSRLRIKMTDDYAEELLEEAAECGMKEDIERAAKKWFKRYKEIAW